MATKGEIIMKHLSNYINSIRELYSDSGFTMSIILTIYILVAVPCMVAFGLFQLLITPVYYGIVMLTTRSK